MLAQKSHCQRSSRRGIWERRELIDRVRRREDEIFGYVGDRGAEASKLALRVYINKRVEGSSEKDYNIKNIPRMKLLTLGERIVRYLKYISGRLELYQRTDIDREIVGIGIKSLILSFLLSGVGKGSRRGLGTIELNVLRDETGLFQGYDSRNLDYNRVKNIILRILPNNGGIENIIPPIPTLAKGPFKLFYIKTEYGDPLRILSDLQGFTLRTQRGRILNRDLLRSKLMAWILGLPREMRRT
ncbi:MAG TPA: hypothetical protein EYP40_00270 [Chromatiales bacterium]|nr:hypothetical protein [Chromatiales bacterium]